MRETITLANIKEVQRIFKTGEYDFDTYTVEVGPQTGCSVAGGLFTEIIDMALEHLARKASHSLVEWTTPEPKHSNVDYDIQKREKKIINYPLNMYNLDKITVKTN